MKQVILAAAAVLTLGTATAFAQGLPAGASPPVYGSQAFAGQPHQNGTLLSRIFGHSKDAQPAPEHNATSVKGS